MPSPPKELSLNEQIHELRESVVEMRKVGPGTVETYMDKETKLITENLKTAIYKIDEKQPLDLSPLMKSGVEKTLHELQPPADLLQKQMESSARCNKILKCLEIIKK